MLSHGGLCAPPDAGENKRGSAEREREKDIGRERELKRDGRVASYPPAEENIYELYTTFGGFYEYHTTLVRPSPHRGILSSCSFASAGFQASLPERSGLQCLLLCGCRRAASATGCGYCRARLCRLAL